MESVWKLVPGGARRDEKLYAESRLHDTHDRAESEEASGVTLAQRSISLQIVPMGGLASAYCNNTENRVEILTALQFLPRSNLSNPTSQMEKRVHYEPFTFLYKLCSLDPLLNLALVRQMRLTRKGFV